LNITDAELPVTNNILKYSRIALKVMDKNNILSDNIMSSGDFSLRKFGSHDNKEINQVIRLKDRRGQNGGKLILTGIVNSIVTIKTNDDDESNNNRNSSYSSSSSKLTNERIGKIQLINCNLTHLSLSSNNNSGNIITNLMSKALSLTAPSSSSPLLLYCIIKIDKWTFRSNINSISSQSTSTLWSLKQTTSTMSVVSMAKTGIIVEIYQQQQQQGKSKTTTANTTSANNFDSSNYNDVLIGISTMKIDLLTMQSNTVVALKADLYKLHDKNREHCIGKIIMNGRYINDENIDESIFPEPQMIFGDENSNNLVTIDEFKMTEMINNDNNKSNSNDNDQQLLFDQEHLEKTLRKEINTKINKEKQDILKILENKNKILQASLEKLNHELSLERKQNQLRDAILAKKTSASTSNENDNGTKKSLLSSITNLKLPSNVKAWRNAHVQAWIQYQLELPQVRSGKCSCQ